jgi:hypothetical protein
MRTAVVAIVLVLGTELALARYGPLGVVLVGAILLGGVGIWIVVAERSASLPGWLHLRFHAHERADDFPRYQRLLGALPGWGTTARQYDLDLRPVLMRVARTVVENRHGAAVAGSRDAVRDLFGSRLWPLVDPMRPTASFDQPAPTLTEIAEVVAVLERAAGIGG